MLRGMAVVEARAGGERAGGDGMWGNSASGDRIGGSGLEGRWLQFGSVLLALRHLMPPGALRHHQSFRVIFPNMQTIHLLSFYLSFFFFFPLTLPVACPLGSSGNSSTTCMHRGWDKV